MKEGFSFNFNKQAYKKCYGGCTKPTPITAFYTNLVMRDGLSIFCKECSKQLRKDKGHLAEDKEKRVARQMKYKQKDSVKKQQREAVAAKMKDPEHKAKVNTRRRELKRIKREELLASRREVDNTT